MKRIASTLLVLLLTLSLALSAVAVSIDVDGKIVGTKAGAVKFVAEDSEVSTGILGVDGTPYVYSGFLWEFDYSPLSLVGENAFSFLINPDNTQEGYSLVIGSGKLVLCKKGDSGNPLASADFAVEEEAIYTVKMTFASGVLKVFAYKAFDNANHTALMTVEIADRKSGAFEVSSQGGKFLLDNFSVTNIGEDAVLYDDVRCVLDYTPAENEANIVTDKNDGIIVDAEPGGQDAYIGSPLFIDGEGNLILAKNFVFEYDYVPVDTEWQRDRITFLMGENNDPTAHGESYVVWHQGNQTGAPTCSGYRNNEFDNMRGYAPATYYMDVPCRIRVVVNGTKAQVMVGDPDFAEFDTNVFEMTLDDTRPERAGFTIMTYGGNFSLKNVMILATEGDAIESFGIQAEYVKPSETTAPDTETQDTTADTEPVGTENETDDQTAHVGTENVETDPQPAAPNGSNVGVIVGIVAAVVVVAVVVVMIIIKKKK